MPLAQESAGVPFAACCSISTSCWSIRSQDAYRCTTHALRVLGLGEAEPDRIRSTIGMSLHRTFHALTHQDSTAMADEFCRIFIEHAEQVMANLTHVYRPRATAMELKGRGLLLGIVSNKYRCGVEAVLSRNTLHDVFDIVVGGEDVGEPKPSPEGLFKAVDRLGVAANEVVYVGDSLIDAETASRACMQFAAILTGTTSRDDFEPFGPAAILDDLRELIVKIDEWR